MRGQPITSAAVGGASRDGSRAPGGGSGSGSGSGSSPGPAAPLSHHAATGSPGLVASSSSSASGHARDQNQRAFGHNRDVTDSLQSLPPPPPPPPPPSIDTAASADVAHFLSANPAHPTLQIRKPSITPASVGLQIRTDIHPSVAASSSSSSTTAPYPQPPPPPPLQHPATASTNGAPGPALDTPVLGAATSPDYLAPHLRHAVSAGNLSSALSPTSAIASPALAAMLTGIDITPLPSPIMPGDSSPGPWKRTRSGGPEEEGPSSSSSSSAAGNLNRSSSGGGGRRPNEHAASMTRFKVPSSPGSPSKRAKGYGSLMPATVEAQAANAQAADKNKRAPSHGRNRSISDFVPEALQNLRQRVATIGAASFAPGAAPSEASLHREHYLAAQRGLVAAPADSTQALPSPPPSNKSLAGSELDEAEPESGEESSAEYFVVRSASNATRKRKWRAVRLLGQGTFSKVVLATSQRLPPGTGYAEANLDADKLVAVKIVEHGPAGGADEERIEVSLKREVDILKSVSHASIVHLKALEYTEARALLVLTYCPGGDLFDLASGTREVMSSGLVRRMFAELVSAVRYLHKNYIVHRDIKLENVLVNPYPDALASIPDPATYPSPIICLTDLGLSRRIPPPPASPLLTTRCGSEDYAAPEILLGQPYDGRSTDSWALGVLLYALMEGRLPFDTPPGKPERSRVSHRVARCDWIWCRFGDEDGDWDETNPANQEWRGGKTIVEALLKKVRMGRKTLTEIEQMDWAREGVTVPGGLRVAGDDDDQT